MCPLISLDLLNESNLVSVHVSPPCGTGLPSDADNTVGTICIHGFPFLKMTRFREQTNHRFEFMYTRDILFSIERPVHSLGHQMVM